MLVPSSLFIALRYARTRQKNSFVAFINSFSVAGITLGLMALITVISIMNGFENQLKQRVLGVVPHLLVSSDMPKAQLLAQQHVVGVIAHEEVEAIVQSTNAIRGIQLQGVTADEMKALSIVSQHVLMGQLSLSTGSFSAVIGRSLATQLNVGVGDDIRILVAGTAVYTPFGRLPSQRLAKVEGIFDLGSQVDDTVVYMHWQDVQKLKRKKQDTPSQWRVFLSDAFQFGTLQQHLTEQGIQSESWRQRQGTLFDAVKMEKNLMFIMLLLIIAVAAFNVVSALVMVVTEKQTDIAILQTQGMQPSSIMAIFLANGLLNGVKGAFFGSILGAVSVVGINPLLELLQVDLVLAADGRAVPILVDYPQIVAVIGLSLLLCLLASVYPARRAMKMMPAQTLHNS